MNNHFSPAGRSDDRPVGIVVYKPGEGFAPSLSQTEIGQFSTLALAHLGDGIFELMMRTALAQSGVVSAANLHRETVKRVNAPAQAKASGHILPLLTSEEHAVFKRGRNAKVNGIPQKADVSEYHAATGLETLFGWLWLSGDTDRLTELFNHLTEVL